MQQRLRVAVGHEFVAAAERRRPRQWHGVSAALLAEAGLVGPRFILEADWGGFYKTYAGAVAKPEATVAALGREFRILQTGQKPFPCCRGLHSSVEALLDLIRRHKISA